MRAALGASRKRLARQFLAESLLVVRRAACSLRALPGPPRAAAIAGSSIGEIALASMLLVAAGLLARSFGE